jgi:hypothetical protein
MTSEVAKTSEQIIDYLVADIKELMEQQQGIDINDGFYDYLDGIIGRSQTILRMMGIPEELIPQNGDC